MCPEVTTHELQEVINHIKRRTGIDRSKFDTRPEIINLQNGLLNIHTREFKVHSSDEFSLVQLPIKYDPNAKCPNILRFLGQVFKPKDVFTALELKDREKQLVDQLAKYKKGRIDLENAHAKVPLNIFQH